MPQPYPYPYPMFISMSMSMLVSYILKYANSRFRDVMRCYAMLSRPVECLAVLRKNFSKGVSGKKTIVLVSRCVSRHRPPRFFRAGSSPPAGPSRGSDQSSPLPQEQLRRRWKRPLSAFVSCPSLDQGTRSRSSGRSMSPVTSSWR